MIDLIKAATLTPDRELQKKAQQTLMQQRQENPQEFFSTIAQIFTQTDIQTPVRQSAGAILVVSIKVRGDSDYLWLTLPVPIRSTFKDHILNSMIDKEKIVRRAAANIIAALCCIEIPRNQWPGIIQKIAQNINNTDPIVKEVSILTIGFICQQLKEFNFSLSEVQQDTILTGILMALKDSPPEIIETAFKALRDGIQAMGQILKKQQVRQYLITQLVEAINNKKFVDFCIQALLQYVKYNYVLLQKVYAEAFARNIFPIMQNTNEENYCTIAMEFWSVFARQQHNVQSNPNMNKFLTGQLAEKLLQILLQNLCFVEQTDDEANGISQGAASTLQSIFEGDSMEFQKKILSFTENTIEHQNWKYRQASIRAFALLLLGLPQERSQMLVNSSLLKLVTLLNDQHIYVQLSALKSLGLITEEVPEVFLKHEKCLEILDFVIKMNKNDHFLKYICKIVDNLSQARVSNNVLSPHAGDLAKIFIDILLNREKSLQVVSNCFNTAINLIKCSQNVGLSNQYLDFVLKAFPDIAPLQKQRRDLFSAGLLTLAQVCLMTIRKSEGSITLQQLSTLYNLVVQHYKNLKDVDGDGYYLVSALAFFIPNDRRLVDDFWRYIQFGLEKVNQDEIFKSTISCICDFSGIYKDQISDKLEPLFVKLIELYEKSAVSRELKLDILMCIGELSLQVGKLAFKYSKKLMDLIFISCQGVFSISDSNYAQALQDSIIETLTCIAHGIQEPGFATQLTNYMPYITEFVKLTTEKGRRPKLQYVQQGLMVLADIAHNFPNERQRLQKTDFINERVMTLQRYNKDGHLNQSISFFRQQFKVSL